MKQCPKCGKTYNDGTLNFCLADGTPLTATDVSEPTVVMDRPGPPRKSRAWIFAVIIALMVMAVIGAVAALLIVTNYRQQDLKASGTTSQPSTAASTPKPRTSPTTAVVETSPTPAASSSPDETDGADEIVPIAWDTTAGGFKGEPGRTYKFECPANGTPQGVYGTDIYTDYSSICTAAVHAGVITLAEGGVITLEYRPGRTIYGTTTRHDIKTNPTGEYRRSFIVRR